VTKIIKKEKWSMRKRVKGLLTAAVAGSLSLSFAMMSLAAWQQAPDGRYWYTNSSERGYSVGWELIDGKWYYFDENGWMLSDTVTPDGFQVGSDGSWVQQETHADSKMLEPADVEAFCTEIFGSRNEELGANLYFNYVETVDYQGKTYYVVEHRVFFDGANKSSYWSHLGVAQDRSAVYQCSYPAAGQTYADTFGKIVWPK